MTNAVPHDADDTAAPFLSLARRVGQRLTLRRWLGALEVSAIPLFGAAVVGLGCAHLLGADELPLVSRAVLPAALFLVAAWLGLSAAFALLRRPPASAVLALFDEHTADHEMFLSAVSLALAPRRGPGDVLHLRRAQARLSEAATQISRAVPLRTAVPTVLAPLVLVGLALFGLPAAAAPVIEEDPTLEASVVGERLDEEAKTLKRLEEGLTPEEKEKLEALRKRMQDSAEKMNDPDRQKSPREVLEELERRAREAEALAASLHAGAEALGSAMLAELERHADTAELAGSLRAQDLKPASEESRKLARRLRAEDLSLEAQARIGNAFSKALEVASTDDLKTLLGRHMTAAQGEIERKAPKQAADEFDELARKYAEMDRRVRSREALERLAENLRTSAQRALGRSPRTVQRLASLSSKGNLSRVGTQPPRLSPSLTGQSGTRSNLPRSGSPSSTPKSGAAARSQAPVPGSQKPSGKICAGCPKCGKPGSGGQSPVPGTQPGSPRGNPRGSPSSSGGT